MTLAEPPESEVRPINVDPEREREEQTLKAIGGSDFDPFNNMLVNQAAQAVWLGNADEGYADQVRRSAIFGMMGIEPRDELEGMLAAQMLACHNAAMECHKRAMISEQSIESRNYNLTQANRLSRTFTNLLEALNRHRGKGQQKMTVEHVHVHEGGQAIVGNVQQGGGSKKKSKEQPHAKAVTHAPQPEMRCEDTQRDTVPRARDEER